MDEEAQQSSVAVEEKSPQAVPETEKVGIFMSRFFNSEVFKAGFSSYEEERAKILPKAQSAPEEFRRKLYGNTPEGAKALFEFYNKGCKLVYNPMTLAPDIRDKVAMYADAQKKWAQVMIYDHSATSEERWEADSMRDSFHMNIASEFESSGLVETIEQGRFIARILLGSMGLEKQIDGPLETIKERTRTRAIMNSRIAS